MASISVGLNVIFSATSAINNKLMRTFHKSRSVEAFARDLARTLHHRYHGNVLVTKPDNHNDYLFYDQKALLRISYAGETFEVSVFGYGHFFLRGDHDSNNWCLSGKCLQYGNFVTFYRTHHGDELASPGVLEMFDIMASLWAHSILIMQNDGNLCIYQDESPNPWGRGCIWRSDTAGQGVAPYRMVMQSDGDLVVYDSQSTRIWHSDTSRKGRAPYCLILRDDGNLVIYDADEQPIWTSGTSRH